MDAMCGDSAEVATHHGIPAREQQGAMYWERNGPFVVRPLIRVVVEAGGAKAFALLPTTMATEFATVHHPAPMSKDGFPHLLKRGIWVSMVWG